MFKILFEAYFQRFFSNRTKSSRMNFGRLEVVDIDRNFILNNGQINLCGFATISGQVETNKIF